MTEGETMKAWRVHRYGEPLEVLQLDEVPVPVPEAGELLVEVEGIPMNLNDLERINGGAFTFNGFGWDLGGIVRDEPRTRFAGDGLRVAVDAQQPAPPGKDHLVQGDQPITSRNPILRQMDVRVYLLEVHFSE